MKIGTVELPGVVALAPMAGVTDFAFRRLCRSCGAALTTTEMVSARALAYNDGRSRELLYMPDDEAPAAVQIFGNEPDIMAEAAQIAIEISRAAILDINMGCPVGKIVKSGDGSALMKTPELAGKIIEAVCRCVTVPVTVKFRKGWDNGSVNAVEFAEICEQAGASALTVHGRTRAQMYSGHADREIIREVKKAVSVPLTANGDIFSGKDAAKMMQYTGCDMVMIGRGCFGDPWLFARANAALRGEDEPALPPLQDRMDAAVRQIEDLAVQRGERAACLEARHQLPWYLHGVAYSGVYRQQMVHVETLDEIRRIASQVKRDLR
ncbi:MAG: tRNA dihydrouridine synthase DusB [Oscillospiraceae bacterium]|nr:tRNA dihydrouridine synthase DusB [Oscillospiraceae bacterium]